MKPLAFLLCGSAVLINGFGMWLCFKTGSELLVPFFACGIALAAVGLWLGYLFRPRS